jgi:hypothetical protein
MDHMTVDAAGQKLFIAALANNTVEVVGIAAGTHVKSLTGFREPTGIASVRDAGSVVVANGQGDGVRTIDAVESGGDGFIDVLDARAPVALKPVARVSTAAGARTSLYVPDQSRLYLAVPHRGTQRAEIRGYEIRA